MIDTIRTQHLAWIAVAVALTGCGYAKPGQQPPPDASSTADAPGTADAPTTTCMFDHTTFDTCSFAP